MSSLGVEKTNSLVLSIPSVVHEQVQGRGLVHLHARLARTLASAHGGMITFVALVRGALLRERYAMRSAEPLRLTVAHQATQKGIRCAANMASMPNIRYSLVIR